MRERGMNEEGRKGAERQRGEEEMQREEDKRI